MAEYDNTNSGALFINDRKEKPSHPDYRGSINSDGTEYWVSAWVKTTRNGDKFLSLALTPKDEQKARSTTPVKNDAADFLSSGPVADAAARHKANSRDSKGDLPGRPSAPPDFDSFDDDIPF